MALVLGFLAVPLAELVVAVLVAQQIGVAYTLVLLAATTILGVWVVRSARRQRPRSIDGALRGVGGALLVLPGFLTDAIGLLLQFPPVRALARAWLGIRLERKLSEWNVTLLRNGQVNPIRGTGPVIRGEVVDEGGDRE